MLEGRTIPDCFAESRTVLIPQTSDTDDLGRILRSLDALRPMTLCNCDCKLLNPATCQGLQWYTMRCIHPSQRCISSWQMTDNIFESETTALAQLCRCISKFQSFLDFLCAREHGAASCEALIGTASHTWNLREQNKDNSSWPEEYDRVVLRVDFSLRWPLTRSSEGFTSQLSQTLTTWNSCSLLSAVTLTISLLHHSFFRGLLTRFSSDMDLGELRRVP